MIFQSTVWNVQPLSYERHVVSEVIQIGVMCNKTCIGHVRTFGSQNSSDFFLYNANEESKLLYNETSKQQKQQQQQKKNVSMAFSSIAYCTIFVKPEANVYIANSLFFDSMRISVNLG